MLRVINSLLHCYIDNIYNKNNRMSVTTVLLHCNRLFMKLLHFVTIQ